MDSRLGNSRGLAEILPFGSLRSVCGGVVEWGPDVIIGVERCQLMKPTEIGTSGTAATRTSSNCGNGTYGRLSKRTGRVYN